MLERSSKLLILGAMGVLVSACSAPQPSTTKPVRLDPFTLEPMTPDSSFGSDDVEPATGAFEAGAQAVAIQDDGKIVVAGYSRGLGGESEFAVARYHPDGTLDTSFDGDGMAITSLRSASNTGMSLAIHDDGKIVVVGYSGPPGSHDFVVARYDSNGSLDSSFGGTGTVTTSVSDGNDEAMAVAIQSNGGVVVAGVGAAAFELVRYTPDGTLDPTFGDAGIVSTSPGQNGGAWGIAIQSDGRIVVAGRVSTGTALARYLADGQLDPSFDGDGIVKNDIALLHDQPHALVIQPDGRIVVGGYYSGAAAEGFAVVRYKPDGSLDSSFGVGGILETKIAVVGGGAYAVTLQPDGGILVVSERNGERAGGIAITRYDANGKLATLP